MSKISCPNCGAFLQIEDDMLGTTIACGGCANEFIAAKPKPRYDYELDDWAEDDDDPPRRRASIDDDDQYDDDVDDLRRRRRYRRHKEPQSGYAIASLVCGIVALVASPLAFCIVGSFISIPCGVVGIVLGVIGMKPGSKGLAIGGITTGAIAIIASIALLITYFVAIAQVAKMAPMVPPPPPPPTRTNPNINPTPPVNQPKLNEKTTDKD